MSCFYRSATGKNLHLVCIIVVMFFLFTVSLGVVLVKFLPDRRRRRFTFLPREIDAGERKEPHISVYITERDVVETMPIEEYIAGVVAGEMDPSWPLEALAAQAIIARTFTLQKLLKKVASPPKCACFDGQRRISGLQHRRYYTEGQGGGKTDTR